MGEVEGLGIWTWIWAEGRESNVATGISWGMLWAVKASAGSKIGIVGRAGLT